MAGFTREITAEEIIHQGDFIQHGKKEGVRWWLLSSVVFSDKHSFMSFEVFSETADLLFWNVTLCRLLRGLVCSHIEEEEEPLCNTYPTGN